MPGLVLPVVFLILFGLVAVNLNNLNQNKSSVVPVKQETSSPSASVTIEEVSLKKTPSPKPLATSIAKNTTSPSDIPVRVTVNKHETKIEVEENALTTAANQTLAGVSLGKTPLGDAKVSNVGIKLQNGAIKITGNAMAGLISLPIEANAKVNLVDGKPKVEVENVKVGVIPLPSSVNSLIESPIQTQIDNLLKDKNMEIKSINIENGKLTIIGIEK